MTTMRREMLAGIGLTLGVATAGRVGVAMRDHDDQVSADLDHYRGLGSKASGGTGDIAVGDWLATELAALGFTIERQPISVPFFTVDRAEVEANGARAEVVPQAIVVPTAPNGVTGTLVRVDPATASANAGRLDGAIALVDLPFARWSSARPIRGFVDGLFAAGAKAALLVTNGPAGGAIALNADGAGPMFAGPVAVLAPSDAARFHVAAAHGGTATLRITGEGGRRPAFNIAARLDRGSGAWLAVSTPRSGWFTCAGSAAPASPSGSALPAGRSPHCRRTISPSSAPAAMNMKTWALSRRWRRRRPRCATRRYGFISARMSPRATGMISRRARRR